MSTVVDVDSNVVVAVVVVVVVVVAVVVVVVSVPSAVVCSVVSVGENVGVSSVDKVVLMMMGTSVSDVSKGYTVVEKSSTGQYRLFANLNRTNANTPRVKMVPSIMNMERSRGSVVDTRLSVNASTG